MIKKYIDLFDLKKLLIFVQIVENIIDDHFQHWVYFILVIQKCFFVEEVSFIGLARGIPDEPSGSPD